jgi:hypothetical protein
LPQLQNTLARELAKQLFGKSFYCLDRAPLGGQGKRSADVEPPFLSRLLAPTPALLFLSSSFGLGGNYRSGIGLFVSFPTALETGEH